MSDPKKIKIIIEDRTGKAGFKVEPDGPAKTMAQRRHECVGQFVELAERIKSTTPDEFDDGHIAECMWIAMLTRFGYEAVRSVGWLTSIASFYNSK